MASLAPNKCSSWTVSCLANKPAGLSQSEADSVLQGFSEAYKLLLTQKEAMLAATDGPSLESALGTLLNELVTISEVFAVTLEIWSDLTCFQAEIMKLNLSINHLIFNQK